MTKTIITIYKKLDSSSPASAPRIVRISLPATPFDLALPHDRPEADPDPRISMCNPARRSSLENAYTKIKRAINEVRNDWG